MSTTGEYHLPVMAPQCIEGLNINPEGIYVDVTFGGGGHSKLILEQLGENGRLIAFDRDADAQTNMVDDSRFTLVHHNYRFMKNYLKYLDVLPVDGILADLGVSSFQLNEGERGFSYRFNGALDMRMDKDQKLSALEVVNEYSEAQLFEILRSYAELNNSRKVSSAIYQAARIKRINTTEEFIQVIQPFAPKFDEYSYYSRVFQAIRLEVNDEIGSLHAFLNQTVSCLRQGGRLVVLTYHSLEDRPVKNLIQKGNVAGVIEKDIYGRGSNPYKVVGKDITANQIEIDQNPRARSARLRVAEKL